MAKRKNIIEKSRPSENATRWFYLMPSNRQYVLDLERLAKDYERYVAMSDEEFADNLVKIAHYAVFVSFYKNLKPMDTISDEGIVHQLIHLIQFKDGNSLDKYLYKDLFPIVRAKFKELLQVEMPKTIEPVRKEFLFSNE